MLLGAYNIQIQYEITTNPARQDLPETTVITSSPNLKPYVRIPNTPPFSPSSKFRFGAAQLLKNSAPGMKQTSKELILKSFPNSERPRERCLGAGSSCLSLRECLALILNSGPVGVGCLGLASRILDRPTSWGHPTEEERAFFIAMEATGAEFLREIDGLGPSQHARLLAAFELGKRYTRYRFNNIPPHQNTDPPEPMAVSKVANRALQKISLKYRNESQEWLGFVPLHRSGELGELCLVERGTRTHVNIDPGELFARILALRPYGYFLFHNHPTGVTSPSLQDLDLTERVSQLSRQLGIKFLGHWIVTPQTESWIGD